MLKPHTTRRYLFRSFLWVGLAYIAALAAAAATVALAVGPTGDWGPLVRSFVADCAATLVIYLFGRVFRNASFYDPYWSIGPIVLALYWLFSTGHSNSIGWPKLVVLVLVCIWGIRLTVNWAMQWRGLEHEDWRYVNYRQTSGPIFWLVELVGIDFVPTIVVFLGSLSLYSILTAESFGFGPLQVVATVVTATAILVEALADRQLKHFTATNSTNQGILNEGLWKYSRHPNYLGEILFWWGIWLFVPGFDTAKWLTLLGPLSITALFVFVSIPLMEKRNLKRRPGYAEQVRRVSVLIPWFPKR